MRTYRRRTLERPGRSSAWSERRLWEAEAGGSNPPAPTLEVTPPGGLHFLAVLRLASLAALVLLLAACGPSGPKTYNDAKSRACFDAAGNKTTTPPASDFVASTALGGSFRVRLGKNFVTISFGKNPTNAQTLDNVYRSVHSRNVGIDDVLRMDGNAVMLWHAHPTDAQLGTVSGCLKT